MIDYIFHAYDNEEKIEFFNQIQNFGYLIGIDKVNFKIEFVSKNIEEIFNLSNPETILGKKISDFLPFYLDFDAVLNNKIGERNRIYHPVGRRYYYVSWYQTEKFIYIEFELDKTSKLKPSFYQKADAIINATSKTDIWQLLADNIKTVINYNRVMVFQFLESTSGVVIAESIDEGLDSLKGLHYPEFDLPESIKDYLIKKRSIILTDVDQEFIPIITNNDEIIDLTYSDFRSLSPSHLNNLRKSNCASSFIVSIVVNNKLWGIVTCRNDEPKHISQNDRIEAKILTKLTRITYLNLLNEEKFTIQDEIKNALIKLKENLLIEEDFFKLDYILHNIRILTEANGIAYVYNNSIYFDGQIPALDEVLRIRDWAKKNNKQFIFSSNSFFKDYEQEIDLSSKSAGVLFKTLDKDFDNFLIWFKEEHLEEFAWAGVSQLEENHFFEENVHHFTPHSAFEVQKIILRKKSYPWSIQEKYVANEVVNLILETTHIKSFKIRELYDQLKEVNSELDSFSYTVSHDLRTPLTVMKLNCQILEQELKKDEKKISKVKEIIDQIDYLNNLMQEILELSKTKKSQIVLDEIDTKTLIPKIVNESKIYYYAENTEVIIGELHPIICDKTMAYEIFLNIINNAIKYSSKEEKPIVNIDSFKKNDKVIYQIKDNGIGIREEDTSKMFKLFSRMSNTDGYSGHGIGLSIVYRMMERINGKITFKSQENIGTEFILEFDNPK